VKLTLARTAVPVILAVNLTGCFWVTTKSEGETLRHDVDSLNTRISSKEKALDDQVKQLQQVIDEATKVLKRNNADIGADVDQLRTDVRTANGLATSINNSMNELKTTFDKYQKDNDTRLDGLEARIGQPEREQLARRSVAARQSGVRSRPLQRRDRHLQAARHVVPDAREGAERALLRGPVVLEPQGLGSRDRRVPAARREVSAVGSRRRRPVPRIAGGSAAQELHRGAHLPRAHQAEVSEVERAQAGHRARRSAQARHAQQGQVQLVTTTCRRAS
jgi:hypothetical protein